MCQPILTISKRIKELEVLIETLWNVKCIDKLNTSLVRSRINRNIVECKVCSLPDWCFLSPCINRNIVECKGTTATTE